MTVDLTFIAPAHNEQDNVAALVREIDAVAHGLGLQYEIVIVDDASTDDTRSRLREILHEFPRLRSYSLPRGSGRAGNGQSAAFRAGILAARGELIVMLDADLQNDPADIPDMLGIMRETGADLVQGDRSEARCDSAVRRVSSWIGLLARRVLLGDSVRDTGCSLRIIRRDIALRLPLEFRGMHRFIPITVKQMGGRVVEHPVSHRPRRAGKTKYGIMKRGLAGLIDCFAVRWMRARRTIVEAKAMAIMQDRAEEESEPTSRSAPTESRNARSN